MQFRELPAQTPVGFGARGFEIQPLESEETVQRRDTPGQHLGNTDGIRCSQRLEPRGFGGEHRFGIRPAGLEENRPFAGFQPPGGADIAAADAARDAVRRSQALRLQRLANRRPIGHQRKSLTRSA